MHGEKLYVIDPAFLSFRSNTFNTQNMGWRLENAVFIELLHRASQTYSDVFYYRERGFEVDFLVAKSGVVESIYQVCYDLTEEKTRKREITSLLQGARKFSCRDLTIITFSQEEKLDIDGYLIKVIPATKWLV